MGRVEHYPNGTFCRVDELVSADLAAARGLYGELFGWASEDLPGPFPRTTFTLGDLLVGGGHAPAPQEDPTPHWSIVADPQGAVFSAAAVPGGPARGVDGS